MLSVAATNAKGPVQSKSTYKPQYLSSKEHNDRIFQLNFTCKSLLPLHSGGHAWIAQGSHATLSSVTPLAATISWTRASCLAIASASKQSSGVARG